MKAALEILLPRIVDCESTVREFRGREDLLRKLPSRLMGYANWADASELGVVVVIGKDRDDCVQLKERLRAAMPSGGRLEVFSAQQNHRQGRVLHRIACEELEAWFFGDVPALASAYPRVPQTLGNRAAYRDPDAIAGATWEALERVLQRVGYHPGGLPKLIAAKAVAEHMNVEENRSMSFRHFRDGVRRLVGREAN